MDVENQIESKRQLKLSLESTQKFFDMWLENYQSIFGRMTQIPTIGPIREKQEKLAKSLPIYANLYTSWIESNVNFQSVFMESMRRAYEKTIKEIAKEDIRDINSEKYKEFYKVWIDTYSETFKEFLKSGHFLSDMEKFMSHLMDFQKCNREMIEENFLKPLNLPTKTDIDAINKEIYTIKKAMKDLNHKIDELSKISVKTENNKNSLSAKAENNKNSLSAKAENNNKKVTDDKKEAT